MRKVVRRVITVLLAVLAFWTLPGIAHAVITRLGVPEGLSAVVSIVLGIVAAVAIVTYGWHRAEDFAQLVKAEEPLKTPDAGSDERIKALDVGSEEQEREVEERFEGFKQGIEDESADERKAELEQQYEEQLRNLIEIVKREGATGKTVSWPEASEELLEEVKARLAAEGYTINVTRSVLPEPRKRKRPSREVREAVFRRDGGRCVECGDNFDLQYDHVIPWSLGGADTVENLQLLCSRCNQSKGNRHIH